MPAKKTTKATPASSVAPVPDTIVETTKVDAPVAEEPTDVPSVDKYTTVLEKLQSFASDLKEMIAVVKQLQKEHTKMVKQTTKRTKKVSGSGTRTLSGFAKPSLLSDEMCDFMGVEHGSSLARTEVTRMINEYIKNNNLQDNVDKRTIIPDAKLKKILNLSGDEKLTYFNLQKHMKHHFTKDA